MLKQKFILHFFTSIGLQIITSVTGIIVARLAGPEVIGTVAYGASYVALFGFTLGLFGSSHLKLISEGKNLGDCITTYGVIQSVNIGLFIGIFLLYNFFYVTVFKSDFSEEQIYVIWIYFGFYVISQFLSIMQITFSAQIDVAKSSISITLQNISYNAARIIVVVLGLGAVALTAVNYVGLLIAIPITWYYFKRYPFGEFDKQLMKEYLKVSLPFFIIGVCGTMINNIGRIFLEYFDDVTQIGLYTAGYSIASMLLLISSTTGTIFFPLFSKLVAKSEFDSIIEQIYKYQKFILQFILPLVILIALFSKHIIILLLGQKYLESDQILRILIISSFIQLLIIPLGNFLVGLRLYNFISYMNIIQLLFFIGCLLIFLHNRLLGMGAAGLALSTLLLSVTSAFLYYYKIFDKTKINSIKKEYIIILLVGAFVGLGGYFLTEQISTENVIFIFTLGVLLIPATFYLFLYVLKLITIEDFKFFFRLFNMQEILKYIKIETKN